MTRLRRHLVSALIELGQFLAFVLVLGLAWVVTAAQAPTYTESYVYDDLGRLKQAQYGAGRTEQFTYDAAGNRQAKALASTVFSLKGDGAFDRSAVETIEIRRDGDLSKAQRLDLLVQNVTAVAGLDYRYWLASAPGTVYTTANTTITVDFAAAQAFARRLSGIIRRPGALRRTRFILPANSIPIRGSGS